MNDDATKVNGARRVLVFDSGVGGLSVFDAIARAGAGLDLDYVADNAWLPYGLKSDADLKARVPALLTALANHWKPDVVVIACNTASTIALEETRAALSLPVVGVVPPIKPAAALTKSGVIGLLATPATVARTYTNDLIARFAADKHLIRFGSSALVAAAEAKLRGKVTSSSAIQEAIVGLFAAPRGEDLDVVALACTHFPLIVEELQEAAPKACVWLDSGAAIARRVVQVSNAAPGVARANRVAFTDADAFLTLASALRARGLNAAYALDTDKSPALHAVAL
jgi:glutamate racemase